MKGIYTDQTYNYLYPEEPNVNDNVKIKIRVPKYLGKTIGNVYFAPEKNSKKYKHQQMKIVEENENFDFYQSEFRMPNRIFCYHFEIDLLDKNQKIKYDSLGVVNNRFINDFVLIPDFKTPEWSHGTVYYQIFPDRFSNGDEKNDPVDNEYIYDNQPIKKKSWDELPSQDNGHREFYGGDLQGIINKIDYLKDLGVETIYLNPIFVSPSPHKYDTQDYEHIDPHLGEIIEDSDDLSIKYKIRTTSEKNLKASDEKFLELTNKLHDNNFKIIIDGVFNHCGSFNKWIDELNIYGEGVLRKEDSPYKDFLYWHDDHYEGWWGYYTLPKLNYSNIKLWKYISTIVKKWNGEPYKVDGWRLDVADDLGKSLEENTTFWRYFNKIVKKTNKEAIVFAEIYKSPLHWVENKSWDSIMNYITCMEPISYFLTGLEKHSDSIKPELNNNSEYFVNTVKWGLSQLPMNSKHIALNQLSNHDHSRWITRTTLEVGRVGTKGYEAATKNKNLDLFKIGLIMMFTLPGSPGLYYGDEIGLGGFTDPDCRRPYPWNKLTEENIEILQFTKKLISIYRSDKVFKKSSFEFINNEGGFVSYGLWNKESKYIVIVNNENYEKDIDLPLWLIEQNKGALYLKIANKELDNKIQFENGNLKMKIPEKFGGIFQVINE